ncbi:MAG: lipid asymmetry maintenance protein MlaB [Gammaproteobacteria bacterium]
MDLVHVAHVGDRTEVRLTGRLGVSEVADVQRRLDAALAPQRPIVLDAAKLSGIDTAGLQLLLAFHRAAQARGLNPRWINTSAALHEGATRLGLETLLSLETDRDV